MMRRGAVAPSPPAFLGTLVLALLVLGRARPTLAQGLPPSPCPSIYTYEVDSSGRTVGLISLLTPPRFSEVRLMVQMSSPVPVQRHEVGELVLRDGRAGAMETTRAVLAGRRHILNYRVNFPPGKPVPTLISLSINGEDVCRAQGPPANARSTITLQTFLNTGVSEAPKVEGHEFTGAVNGGGGGGGFGGGGNSFGAGGPIGAGGGGFGGGGGGFGGGGGGFGGGGDGDFGGGGGGGGGPGGGFGGGFRPEPPDSEFPPPPPPRPPPPPPNQRPPPGPPPGPAGRPPPPLPPPDLDPFQPEPWLDPTTTTTTRRPQSPQPQPPPLPIDESGEDNEENLLDPTNCGTAPLHNALVVFGAEAKKGQWPWQTALFRNNDSTSSSVSLEFQCGGTLISRKHVVTAAHCVVMVRERKKIQLIKNSDLLVSLGKYNIRNWAEVEQQFKEVRKITTHPQYDPEILRNDLAIIQLSTIVSVSNFVKPICLWDRTADLSPIVGEIGTVGGWGRDETGSLSDNLRIASMPIVSQETCLRSDNNFYIKYTSENTFCAGFRNGTTVCNGDSGGGLHIRLENSKQRGQKTWYLRGVVSLSMLEVGEQTCDTHNFVVFTDVAKYMSWVFQQIY